MRWIVIAAAVLLVGACENRIVKGDANEVVVEGGDLARQTDAMAEAHCAQFGKKARLMAQEPVTHLTFKRYLESPVMLTVENDYVTDIAGRGLDADLFRQYIAAWGDREAYAVSHVGWGMNPKARWESMAMYDKADFNGKEIISGLCEILLNLAGKLFKLRECTAST